MPESSFSARDKPNGPGTSSRECDVEILRDHFAGANPARDTTAEPKMKGERKLTLVRAIVEPDAIRELEAFCRQRGMTQVSVVSRMVMWLARQGDQIQTAILSTGDDDHSKQLGLKLLKQMASTK
jgi:hypothetical protein